MKLLYFKPGGSISTQYHDYRSETWIFLLGKGLLKRGRRPSVMEASSVYQRWFKPEQKYFGKIYFDRPSVYYIPPKYWHVYKAEKRTLVLEIQYGEIVEEWDITRVETTKSWPK